MTSNFFIKGFRMRKFQRSKAAETVESGCPGKNGKHSIIKRLFAFWAERSGNSAKRTSPVAYNVAEYKTAKGDFFRFSVPLTDSVNRIGKFNECFRIVTLERFKQLTSLYEAGLCLPISMLCESCDSENDQCAGCRLIKRHKERKNTEKCNGD